MVHSLLVFGFPFVWASFRTAQWDLTNDSVSHLRTVQGPVHPRSAAKPLVLTDSSPIESAIIESAVLHQAFVAVLVEFFTEVQPERIGPLTSSEFHQHAEDWCRSTTALIRQYDAEFLWVTPADEQQLQAGHASTNAAQRIAIAQQTLMHSGLQETFPAAIQFLLSEHQQANLTPVRTELLAQLMVGFLKRVDIVEELL